jgi:hypothetical protein
MAGLFGGRFIGHFLLKPLKVHGLLNDIADLVVIIFAHLGMLFNGFLDFHLAF